MTDVGEMRWPLKHGCRADRAARRRYCAARPGLSCVLRRHIYHERVLTLGHVLRKNKKNGLSLFLCGACSRTWNGYIHPCQIACMVSFQTTAEIPSARGGQRGVFSNRASPCHDIGSNQAADDNRRLRALRRHSDSNGQRHALFVSVGRHTSPVGPLVAKEQSEFNWKITKSQFKDRLIAWPPWRVVVEKVGPAGSRPRPASRPRAPLVNKAKGTG